MSRAQSVLGPCPLCSGCALQADDGHVWCTREGCGWIYSRVNIDLGRAGGFELLAWHVVEGGQLPDDDTTVMIEVNPASEYTEPVFMGYHDGDAGWKDVHGVAVDVIRWAHLPRGAQ